MLESMFAQSHTLRGNVNDTPISHITKSGKTLPLSSSNVPLAETRTDLIQINEPIRYNPEVRG
jgi:hypothetical protein